MAGPTTAAALEQAITNTRALHEVWLERARTEHPDVTFDLSPAVAQLALFPLEGP